MRSWLLLFALCGTCAFADADLEIQDLKAAVQQDGTAELQFRIRNNGPDAAANPSVRVLSAEHQLAPLAAGESRAEKLTVTGLQQSSILVEAYDLEHPDTRPSNNTLEITVKVPGKDYTDLEILEATVLNAQPIKEKNLVVRLRLLNRGPEPCVNALLTAELRLFQNTTGSAQRRTQKHEPGEDKEYRLSIPLPPNYPATEGVLTVRWLPSSEPAPQDPAMANNTYTLAIPLEARQPDLIVQAARLDGRRELNIWVKNKGTAGASPSITAVYINGALVRRFETGEISAGGEKRLHYGGARIAAGTQVAIVTDYNADAEEISEQNNRLQITAK